jgi:hypothetical protein
MDYGFCRLLENAVELAREKAWALGEIFPLDAEQNLIRFIRIELDQA